VARRLLAFAALASRLKGARPWFVEAHQFRIDTTDGIGRPTPEGAHRDGVDFVAVVLVDARGIKGGETRVFAATARGQRFTMLEPWTTLSSTTRASSTRARRSSRSRPRPSRHARPHLSLRSFQGPGGVCPEIERASTHTSELACGTIVLVVTRLVVAGARRRAMRPNDFAGPAQQLRSGRAGEDLSAARGLQPVAGVVAVGKARPDDEAHAQRRAQGRARSTRGTARARSAPAGWRSRTSAAPSKVVIQLDFIRPSKGTTSPSSRSCRAASATELQWTMRGPATFVSKLMGVFATWTR
jgi:hypothetical protein